MLFSPSGFRFLLAVLFFLFGIGTGQPRIAIAQETTPEDEPSRPALDGRWAVGLQALPVVGPSIRYGVSRRVTLQAAGLPLTFREKGLQGMGGARILYALKERASYEAFGSIAVTAIFDRSARSSLDGETRFEFQTVPLVAATVGAEGRVGSHVSLSGEIGASRMWTKVGNPILLAIGVGVNYYW